VSKMDEEKELTFTADPTVNRENQQDEAPIEENVEENQ